MKFGKNPGLNFSTERSEETEGTAGPAGTVPADREEDDLEGTEGTEDTAASHGYHLLTDLPPEDQRNLKEVGLHDRRTERSEGTRRENKVTPQG